VLFFGLPGNPVSSFVTFELFVRPVLRLLGGHPRPLDRRTTRAVLAEPVTKALDRRAFLRVTIEPRDGELPLARMAGGQGSHMLSALAVADALAVVPEGVASLPAGSVVDTWALPATED
jgi:molybdopterin molybdotransferase